MDVAVDLVRRFIPTADDRTLKFAAVWLVGQCSIFVRNREQLANPPVSLALDEATLDRLAELVSHWAMAGLRLSRLNEAQEIRGVASKIPFSGPAAAHNRCLKFNRPFEKSRREGRTGDAL